MKFFFSASMEIGNHYKIGYLPHTSKAIYAANINVNSEDKIGFPIKEILIYISILICFIGFITVIVIISDRVKSKRKRF